MEAFLSIFLKYSWKKQRNKIIKGVKGCLRNDKKYLYMYYVKVRKMHEKKL